MSFFYAIFASILVSLISLIWLVTLWLKKELLNKLLIYFVWFSTWAMFWDVFLHLLPEFYETWIDKQIWWIYILGWIIIFFVIEKIIHWNHCHSHDCEKHNHKLAKINLVWDIFHNLIDWVIIGSSFMVDYRIWIATTIAIILHEIPQEIWDFWVLLHSWLSVKKALYYNFLTACSAIIWVILPYLLSNKINNINSFLIPFAAWSFIYIAWSDLIPELHKNTNSKSSILQLISILIWIWIMYLLLIVG